MPEVLDFYFYDDADADKSLVRFVAHLNGSLKIVKAAEHVPDHFTRSADRLDFCRLSIGPQFAVLIPNDAVAVYDVKIEAGHSILTSR